MTKKEFIKGITIITIVVCGYYIIGNPIQVTNKPKVKITPIEKTTVIAKTDDDGNIEVIVNENNK